MSVLCAQRVKWGLDEVLVDGSAKDLAQVRLREVDRFPTRVLHRSPRTSARVRPVPETLVSNPISAGECADVRLRAVAAGTRRARCPGRDH